MDKIKPVTIKLSEAVTIGEGERAQSFTEITFTRTRRGKDMIAADAVTGETRKSFAVYASMAGVPLQVFSEMAYGDIQAVMAAVVLFLGKPNPPRADAAMPAESPSSGAT